MNVTNIGFPFAAPASQGGAADGAPGSGFAGLLGAVAGVDGQGQPSFGLLGNGQPGAPLLTADTNAPLLPLATEPTMSLPGDKPQVAMAQLLATAAPVAVAPPVAKGGNPLADAVAKALANATAPGGSASEPATDSAAPVLTPATPDAVPVIAAEPVPSATTTATPPKATPQTAQPVIAPVANTTDVALPGDAPVTLAVAAEPTETSANPRAPQPGKLGTKANRTANENTGPDPAGALLPPPDAGAAAAAVPQPMAVAQVAPVAQPMVQTASTDKPSSQAAGRITKAEAGPQLPGAPSTGTDGDAKVAELRLDGGAKPDTGDARNNGGGDTGQQNFAQQLATADTGRASTGTGPATPNAAAFAPSAATATAAATPAPVPAANEPVIHARPGELGRGLGVEIARKVDAGEDTLRVRLNPAELGRVEVTLAFDDKGRVQATMRAESQHTLSLLRQDAPELGRALDQAGIRNDAGSFRFESRDGSSSGSGANGQSAFQQQSRGGNQQFRDAQEPQPAAYRQIRGDGQVDLIA
ncbi:flagellar hook-length control protein FliK [Sphingomonas azotifigens]|uniref:flagellar hook-length control protein FliK n=1 Tax=Sphingomonas azotifigens TaxID=330920 RepID=UPI000A0541D9|nr:flagellar hook-length control protein FliK [Sphingomonas azotifigens]